MDSQLLSNNYSELTEMDSDILEMVEDQLDTI